MRTRIIAGLLGLPILAAVVILGDLWLLIATAIVAVIGLREFYRAFLPQSRGKTPQDKRIALLLAHIAGYAAAAAHFVLLPLLDFADFLPAMLIILMLIPVLAMVLTVAQGKTRDVVTPLAVVSGHLYVVVALSAIYLLRVEMGGAYEVWLIFIAAWGCDTGAYITGKTFGKRKLAPVLSPNKTLEGAIGGTLTATLLGAAYGVILLVMDAGGSYNIWLFAAVACFCSIAAQFGDLSASAIKRQQGIKDFGRIMPGHGGVLDRFDSVLFAAPVAFVIFWILR